MERDEKPKKEHQSVRDKQKDNPKNPDDISEDRKHKENRSDGMDEDLDAQKGGNYGHKSQDQAEKDGKR